MNLLNNSSFVKSLVIDHFLQKNEKILIGHELQYGSNNNFADLIILKSGKIIAFEIKASNDDLRAVKSQTLNYKQVFDYVYFVVTEKHVRQISELLQENIGLILISKNNELRIIKKPKRILSNKKKEILYSITKNFLTEYFKLPKNLSVRELRLKLMKLKIKKIKQIYYIYLRERLLSKNILFNSERGTVTHYEDLTLLSFNENSEIL